MKTNKIAILGYPIKHTLSPKMHNYWLKQLKINGKYRRFMPKEVARIQSFPEDYQINGSDSKVYHALGDAVPPVLMWHLTKQIVKTIRKTDKRIFNSKPYSSAAEKRSYNRGSLGLVLDHGAGICRW